MLQTRRERPLLTLQKNQRYIDVIQKVEEALNRGSDASIQGVDLEDDPE